MAPQVAPQLGARALLLAALAPGAGRGRVSTRIYWFRNDLRMHDNPGLCAALVASGQLLPVVCHDPALS